MADYSTLLNAFIGQSDAMNAAPPAPWQGELMKMVNPEEQRRQNLAKALAAASGALASTPGNFLQGLAAGASQGSTALVDGQQQGMMQRLQALQSIDQANRQAQADKLGRIYQALGLVGQQEDRTYQRGQAADATAYQRQRDKIGDQRWNQEFDLRQKQADSIDAYRKGRNDIAAAKAGIDSALGRVPGDTKPLTPDERRKALDSINRFTDLYFKQKASEIENDYSISLDEKPMRREQAWAESQKYKQSLMIEYGLMSDPSAGASPPGTDPSGTFKGGPTSAGGGPDRATVEAEAKAALAKGKDPAALRARLTEMGYDPESFDIWK